MVLRIEERHRHNIIDSFSLLNSLTRNISDLKRSDLETNIYCIIAEWKMMGGITFGVHIIKYVFRIMANSGNDL